LIIVNLFIVFNLSYNVIRGSCGASLKIFLEKERLFLQIFLKSANCF